MDIQFWVGMSAVYFVAYLIRGCCRIRSASQKNLYPKDQAASSQIKGIVAIAIRCTAISTAALIGIQIVGDEEEWEEASI